MVINHSFLSIYMIYVYIISKFLVLGGKMDISIILNQLVTLFIVIGLGYFLRKIKLMPVEFTRQLTKLAMPCLIINSVLTMQERPDIKNVMIAFIASFAMYIFLPLIGWIVSKILFVPKKDLGLYIFMTTFLNVGFMGYPLIEALLGNQAIFYTSIVNIVFNLGCYSYGILLVNMGIHDDVKLSPKLLLTPGLIFSFVALILYFFNIHFPESVTKSFTYVGGLTTPLAMLLIGTSLANIDIKKVFTEWRLYIFTAIKQIALPILLCPLIKYFITDSVLNNVIFIMISVPIANSAVLFATEYRANEELAAKAVFISTLLSLATIPIVVSLCF